MSDIIDVVVMPVDPQNIGGIRDGDGDCIVDAVESHNEKSPS